MAGCVNKLILEDIWNIEKSKKSIQELSMIIAERLEKINLYLSNKNIIDQRDELIDNFIKISNCKDLTFGLFNQHMEKLYIWGDIKVDGFGTRLCDILN